MAVVAGGRFVAWCAFVFGSVMSIAANVLHAWLDGTPSIAAQIGAAVWPVALLLSVEVLSRVQWPNGWQWKLARYGGVGTVGLGSALISYGHLNEVLVAWGYGTLGSAVGPIVLDGLMVISGFALLAPAVKPVPAAAAATAVEDAPVVDEAPVVDTDEGDPLLPNVLEWVRRHDGTPSQRKLREEFNVGAGRARKLMEQAGIAA